MNPRKSIDPGVIQILEEAEVDYAFVNGKKHIKLLIDNHLVTILPHGGCRSRQYRSTDNLRALVRRFLRGHKA